MKRKTLREEMKAYWLNFFKEKLGDKITDINNINLFEEKHLLRSKYSCFRGNVIYAIIIDINTFYIGRTIDLRRRLEQHRKNWLSRLNRDYKVHFCSIDEDINLDIVESFFIDKYKPKLNCLSPENKLKICNKIKHKK